MRPHDYILIGQTPVPEPDALKWAAWMQAANRVVAQTQVGDSLVSTVFLGMDHAFFGGPPLLFETMIFTNGKAEDYQERCSTWSQAEQQHMRAIESLRPGAETSWEKFMAGLMTEDEEKE